VATLDNVKLLETKIAKAVDFVKQLTEKNNRITEENKQLKERAESLQNQVNELEFLVLGFKEDQQRIEAGILLSLEKLNQVEDSIGKSAPQEVSASQPLLDDGEFPDSRPQENNGSPPPQNGH
jgi:DNA repair ATPase RecN